MEVGVQVETGVGIAVGVQVETPVGIAVGVQVGTLIGVAVGFICLGMIGRTGTGVQVGTDVGVEVGVQVGTPVGVAVGFTNIDEEELFVADAERFEERIVSSPVSRKRTRIKPIKMIPAPIPKTTLRFVLERDLDSGSDGWDTGSCMGSSGGGEEGGSSE